MPGRVEASSVTACVAGAEPAGAPGPGDRDVDPAGDRRVSVDRMLTVGDPAPSFSLPDQNGETVDSSSLKGRRALVYFYPRADTPGCTTQACGLRDVLGQVGDTSIIGSSPDKSAALAKFDTKSGLGFTLLSDVDHSVAEAFGVWQEKKMYGKVSMGIVRSAFLVGPDGRLQQVWYKISPKDTPTNLLDALASS